ncbi:MAG TPA: gliding motility protein, partial [Pedobacter sp.]
DTVQSLLKLSEADRLAKIKKITTPKVLPAASNGTYRENLFPDAGTGNRAKAVSGTFYFSNSTAMSNGYTDFITKWGNRKPEDNWRQSVRSSAQNTSESIAKAEDSSPPLKRSHNLKSATDSSEAVNKYLSAIPLTTEKLAASNQRIIEAYYEMANFYQQELEDQEEAVRIYQLILTRFPENNRLASIYYSLYLSYRSSDPVNTAKYKKLVVDLFPASAYAKTILDPQYSVKQSEIEAKVIREYNQIFEQYERKDFPLVITEANSTIRQYPNSLINPQLSYLRSIAIGRTQPIDSLVTAFQAITVNYPDDKLIVPLVKDHLAYIAAHKDEFNKRKVALPDFDPAEPRFFTAQPLPEKTVQQPVVSAPTVTAKNEDPTSAAVTPQAINPASVPPPAASPARIFSTAESKIYYYVIDVEDASLTLSSSRFGIGQFNRGNYAGAGLRHQLTEFDNDQLIYVGNFSSFAEAKSYADGITPQLQQIMKVPAGIYSSFIISRKNFEKLQSKDLVTKYLDFYKNNYQK